MKRKAKIGAVLCCSTALVSILGGCLLSKNTGLFNWGNQSKQENQVLENDNLQVEQSVENMTIALLNKSENQDGSISYTYSFTITPANATHKDISGELTFVDGTSGIENFLSFSIDQANSQFTITKLADFSHQAQLVLSCDANPNVNATITLDCKQHFLGYENISEHDYQLVLTNNNAVTMTNVKVDLATALHVNNFSSVFTVRTRTNYRVEQTTTSLTGYVTGDSLDNLSDSGLTIDNTYAISQINLEDDFSLSTLQNAVYADSTKMSGPAAYAFSQRQYFGVAYDVTMIFNVDSVIKSCTEHVVAIASTNNLDFGVPTELSVESNAITYENVQTSVRFIYTDKDNNVSYIEPEAANDSGWSSTGYRNFAQGYINVEVTRKLDGVTITGPTVIYTLNDGKGYYMGEDSSNYYVVFNPGGFEMVRWLSTKTRFNPCLYSLTNYAATTY